MMSFFHRFCRKLWRRAKIIGWCSLGVLALWGVGLLWFQHTVHAYADPAVTKADTYDAIVVLTGGSDRLRVGLELLAQKRAPIMMISGVASGVTIRDILSMNDVASVSGRVEPRAIHLGYEAENTTGNALEVAHWAAENNVRKIVLVTSNYHMPRSLAECEFVMPHTQFVPYAVLPEKVKTEDWLSYEGTRELIVEQYNKYLGVLVRIVVQKVMALI